MVILSRYLRQREREREQLRAEGRAEANAAAREWYERERQNGQQFLDPPFMKDEDAEDDNPVTASARDRL